jgi:hypothetical protein
LESVELDLEKELTMKFITTILLLLLSLNCFGSYYASLNDVTNISTMVSSNSSFTLSNSIYATGTNSTNYANAQLGTLGNNSTNFSIGLFQTATNYARGITNGAYTGVVTNTFFNTNTAVRWTNFMAFTNGILFNVTH